MSESKSKRLRIRFSIRALLILFAIVAVVAGLVGRTFTDHLQEQRLAQRLKESGAEVMLVSIPPKGFMNGLIYRNGGKQFFGRIIGVSFGHGDVFTDEVAAEIGRLSHLLNLRLQSISVSDRQVTEIAKCRSLESLQINLDSKVRTGQRILQLEKQLLNLKLRMPAMAEALEELGVENVDRTLATWEIKQLKETLPQMQGTVTKLNELKTTEIVRPTDAGLESLKNHPSLRDLSISGCNVSDDMLRDILGTLNLDSEIELVLLQRRRNEVQMTGAVITVNHRGIAATDWPPIRSVDYQQFARKKSVSLLVNNLPMDLERLHYVIDDRLEWALFLPELANGPRLKLKDFLKEMAPYRNRVASISAEVATDVVDLIGEFPKVRYLAIREPSDNLDELLQYVYEMRELRGLSIDGALIVDDQVDALAKLTQLKSLHLPRAAITSSGLQALMDSGLQLDELVLPNFYAGLETKIIASGLAKSVRCEFSPKFSGGRSSNDGTSETVRALKGAKFPRPANSPFRPEDHILYQQRRYLLGNDRFKRTPFRVAVENPIVDLRAALNVTDEINDPLDQLIEDPPVLSPLKVESNQPENPKGLINEKLYREQLSNLFGSLAYWYERQGEPQKAVEMRIRQHAWHDVRPNYVSLSELFASNLDSEQIREWQSLFFIEVTDGETTIEQAPSPMVSEWHTESFRGVPILVPPGKHVALSSVNSLQLEVHVRSRYFESKPMLTNKVNSNQVEIPMGNELIFVERKYFPIKITVGEPLMAAQLDETRETQ